MVGQRFVVLEKQSPMLWCSPTPARAISSSGESRSVSVALDAKFSVMEEEVVQSELRLSVLSVIEEELESGEGLEGTRTR